MSKPQKPFTTPRRGDSKTFQLTINPSSGLPAKICRDWCRKSFQDLPDALAQYRNPKTKAVAEAGAFALIQFLKADLTEGIGRRVRSNDMSVGAWVEKFTTMVTSPRTGRNAARNRPYSPDTLDTYKSYYDAHIKGYPFTELKMTETEEMDAIEFINRLSLKKLNRGQPMGGSRTFAGVIIFVRMTFKEYQKSHARWFNPFQNLDPPKIINGSHDALSEDEVLKFFGPGVLRILWNWECVRLCSFLECEGGRYSHLSQSA
ncbi:MAG: hypothetical protein LBD93_11225 [Treponema sp.]|jgi:hypothetical protein|nr:hypothetical protein [Treponema sp.]